MKWIDFGKTAKTDSQLKHDIPWVSGSSEEGLLIGLMNLIEIFSDLSRSTSASSDNREELNEQPSTSNQNQGVISEKPLTSSDSSIVNRRKKNFFIGIFKNCSRTMSKPNS